MTLIETIKATPAALTAAQAGDFVTVQAIVAAYEVQRVDRTPRTTSWLSSTFTNSVGDAGLTEADVVLATLQAATIPRVKAAYQTMTVSGLDFADDSVQSMLPQLAAAGGWPDGLSDRLAAFGVQTSTPFAGATEDDCKRAWVVHETLATIRAAHTAAKSISDAAGIRLNNAEAALLPEHIDDLTLDQLQARCDAIAASSDGIVD